MNSFEDKPLLIELHYLPSIEYFTCLLNNDSIFIEAHENYVKQSYRNRCFIKDANSELHLTVPVRSGRKKILIRDIQIDDSQNWLNVHERAIRSAYGKAPFFEFYFDYFDTIFQKREKFLFDLNSQLLTVCLKILGIDKSIAHTETYIQANESNYLDLRNVINSKQHFSNRTFYQAFSYPQVFGKDFAPNLSIVDLVMNEGPNAPQVIRQSVY